jgi:hypothetical protein
MMDWRLEQVFFKVSPSEEIFTKHKSGIFKYFLKPNILAIKYLNLKCDYVLDEYYFLYRPSVCEIDL